MELYDKYKFGMKSQGGTMTQKKEQRFKLIVSFFIFPLLILASATHLIGQNDYLTVYGCTTTEECQQEIAAAQQKREQLQNEQKTLEQKSDDTKAQIQNIVSQIELYATEITAVNIQLTNLEAQHKQLVASIQQKDQLIKSRLIETQLSYETNQTLDFIANSSSITEMIERVQVVDAITEADQNMIRVYEAQKEEVIKNEEAQKQRRQQLEKLVEAQKILQQSKEKELAEYMAAAAAASAAQTVALRDEQLSQAQLAAIERAKQSVPTVTNGTALQNERAAFAYFVSQGYTKAAAAGIIGNFYIESGMNPTQAQIGGPGMGIGQWGYNADGGRYNQLLTWAAKNNLDPTALGTQLAWTVKEMISYGMDPTMKSITSVSAATEYFGRVWERPACLSCTLQQRIGYANQAYARNA